MQSLKGAVPRYAALGIVLVVWIAGCGGRVDLITPASCLFSLSPSSASQATGGGLGSVTVNASDNCSWTVKSEADWVKVTGGSSGSGSGTVTYRVAANTTASARTASIEVMEADSHRAAVLHQVNQAASTRLRLRGAYTLVMQFDSGGECGWPVTTFYWPVFIKVSSSERGTILGSIVFPRERGSPLNTWSFSTSPSGAELVPSDESPGPAGGAYDVVVEGGRYEAGGLVRARDGRGQITGGTASGVKQILTLRGSDKRWECQSDVKWSLLTRYNDRD